MCNALFVGAGIAAGALALAVCGFIVRSGMRNVFAATPKGVLRRLQKSSPVQLRLKVTDGIWNPEKPLGVGNRIFGPGEATYWQDEAGTVHLEIRAQGGQLQRFEGPVPETLILPSARRSQKILRLVLAGYVAMCLGGLVTGLLVAGNTAAHRLIGAIVGLFVAIMLVAVGGTVLRVAVSVRSLLRKGEPDSGRHGGLS